MSASEFVNSGQGSLETTGTQDLSQQKSRKSIKNMPDNPVHTELSE